MPGDDLNEALLAFLRIGVFIGGGGLILLLLVPANTPEQVLSACSAGIGGVIVFGVAVVRRIMS